MDMESQLGFYTTIAVLSLINFARIFMMLIGSDIYDLRQIWKVRRKRRAHQPFISVIIPAHNEEFGVIRTVESVMANCYKKKEIIVVNDGSTDGTLRVLRNYQKRNPREIKIVNQKNSGKAMAINKAIRKWSKGKLVMVLDADSLISPDGLEKMVEHFRDRRVIAAASNVKIIPNKSLFGLAQRFEYLISYRMKRALSVMNMEYIIGGVGSTFRKSALTKVGLFDNDTMTEDIDLTVKIIREFGNKYYKIHYAADCLTYTEHVLTFKSLIKQRFRWKYGRFQTLLKNKPMFFSKSKKYDKRLTWYQLPYALFGELALLVEPILVGYILLITVLYSDFSSLLSVYIIVTTFIFLMLLGEQSEKNLTKLWLSLVLPVAYFLMYILTIVEFAALAGSIKRVKKLINREDTNSTWEHVERTSKPVTL